jgi:RHS repeat-associated protein
VWENKVLVFSDLEERYDTERDLVVFWGLTRDRRIQCAISREALDDYFIGDNRNKLEVLWEIFPPLKRSHSPNILRAALKQTEQSHRCTSGRWSQFSSFNTGGVSSFVAVTEQDSAGAWINPFGSTTYYHGDQIGSARLLTAGAGWPVSSDVFYPFGQEQSSTSDPNHYKFTGKERDTESGLDYFGARYYGSSMGRFMSPDPLLNSGRPDNPQTWNRYAYALNNPLTTVDPTGLYNLDSDCLKNKACAASAEKLRNGVSDLTKAANGMKAGADKDRLLGALKTLGTENDENNVGVSFAALGGSIAGHTDVLADASGKQSGFKITLDPSKNGSSDLFGINAAHESTHVNNLQDGSFSDFSDETRAYQTSAASASALWQYHGSQGTGTFTLNGKSGKSVIWNSSWGVVDDKVLTNHIIQNYHYSNGKPYEETMPHDGGKP